MLGAGGIDWCIMSREFTRDSVTKFLPAKTSRKIFTAHCAYRNADLNLTLFTGTTNGFIVQIIKSLIESCGVRLTPLSVISL